MGHRPDPCGLLRHRPALLPSLGRALPGSAAILAELAGRDDVVQSLVTGNLPALANYTLAAFDLHHHIDFEIGGYGSLSEQRHDLVAAAIDQASAKHSTFDSVVVIGDTPHDVAAGLHHGTTTVGVATGRFTEAELAESGCVVYFGKVRPRGCGPRSG